MPSLYKRALFQVSQLSGTYYLQYVALMFQLIQARQARQNTNGVILVHQFVNGIARGYLIGIFADMQTEKALEFYDELAVVLYNWKKDYSL